MNKLFSFRVFPFLGFFIFAIQFVNAQEPLNTSRVIPPSPNASSLGKFVEVPVSLYTGIPQIGVPLHEITLGNIKIPVSLSYHAGGIKVNEIASNIGIGWALNAGGVITRSICGKPDESGQGYLSTTVPSGNTCFSGTHAYEFCSNNTISRTNDVEPDVFYYNFNGNSGKFVLDKQAIPHTIPYNKLKIEPSSVGLFGGWKITTEDGTQYIFEKTATSVGTMNANANADPPYIFAWYLTEIRLPNSSKKVSFSYTLSQYSYDNPVNETLPEKVQEACGAPGQCPNLPPMHKWLYSTNYVDEAVISKITFPEGTIDFMEGNYRYDLKGSRVIDRVIIKRLDGSTVRSFKLNHKYFTNSAGFFEDDGLATSTTAAQTKLRLCLTDVVEYAADGITKKPSTRFTYYTDSYEHFLPDRINSFAIDHWGYYNGRVLNTTSIPIHYNRNQLLRSGAWREADENFTKVGTLTKITYPTGGYTDFTYEQNDAESPNLPDQPVPFEARYDMGFCHVGGNINFEIKDEVTGNGTVVLNISGQLDNFTATTCNGGYSAPLPEYSNTGSYIFFELINITDPANPFVAYTRNGNFVLPRSGPNSNTITLPNGKYKIRTVRGSNSQTDLTDQDASFSQLATFTISGWYLKKGSKNVGGLRVKKIVGYDPVVNKTLIKTYDYKDGTHSSGKSNFVPKYRYGYQMCGCQEWDFFVSSSMAPLAQMNGSFAGYSKVTVYNEEVFQGASSNGKTEYYYTNPLDLITITLPASPICYNNYYGPGPSEFPFAPTISTEWKRGQLLRQIFYKSAGNSYVKVKEVVNTYKDDYLSGDERIYNGTTDILGYKIGITGSNTSLDGLTTYNFVYQPYFFPSRCSKLVKTEEYNYNLTGNKYLVNRSESHYDNLSHLQPTRSLFYSSDGSVMAVHQLYPHDYTNTTGFIGEMKDANIIQQPVETVKYKVEPNAAVKIISGQVNTYKTGVDKGQIDKTWNLENKDLIPLAQFRFTNQASAGVLPQQGTPSAFSMAGNYPAEERNRFAFDDGNMLSITKTRDISKSYIWDYKQVRPVAEVVNSMPADIAYTSFEADGTGNWSGVNTSSIQNNGGITGSKFYSESGFNISKSSLNPAVSYVVSYWTLNNAAYSISGTQTNWPKKLHTITINGNTWNYFEHLVSGQSTITLNGSGSIDELRLYPNNAQMTTYTYDPLIGMTSQCDKNNRITYYEYDGFGRLQVIKDQYGNIIKTLEYHYAP
jgi:hypothetical protein